MEREGDATMDAGEYINSQKYTFDVLMDLKDPVSKTNKVVKDYGVSGIPSKFVIDKDGNIRFFILGFDRSDEAVVDEI